MAIRHKRTSIAGYVWQAADLLLGQLGINTNDGTIHLKKDDDTIVNFSAGGGGGADLTPTTWTQLSLLNNWQHWPSEQIYYRQLGTSFVEISGCLWASDASVPTDKHFATMPSGLRPSKNVFVYMSRWSTALNLVIIQPDGVMRYEPTIPTNSVRHYLYALYPTL